MTALSIIARIRRAEFLSLSLSNPVGVVAVERDGVAVTRRLDLDRRVADAELVLQGMGQVVEEGPTAEVIRAPRHPYTRGLLASIPRLGGRRGRQTTIAGTVPPPGQRPPGCIFAPRCERRQPRCAEVAPSLQLDGAGRAVACWNPVP